VVARQRVLGDGERKGARSVSGQRRLRTIAPRDVGIAILALSSAAVVGRLVAAGATRDFDHQCRREALRRRSKPVKSAAKLFSTVGEPAAQMSLAVLASLALARRSRLHAPNRSLRNARALTAASSPIVSSLVAIGAHRAIKMLFKRRRPPGALVHGKLESSFPSGHASVTTATACTIAYAARDRGAPSAYVVSTALVLSTFVGLSRILLDKHWATDVIAGWLVGLGIASGTTVLSSSLVAPATHPISSTQTRSKRLNTSRAQ
jgi:membrane-associated phospholipid phosphatase